MELNRFFLIIVFLCLAGVLSFAEPNQEIVAEVPFSEGAPVLEQTMATEWSEDAADRALETGLPALAEGLYRGILSDLKEGSSQSQRVRLKLVSALIAQRRFSEAEVLINSIEGMNSSAFYLRKALLALQRNVFSQVEYFLGLIIEEDLVENDASWLFLLKGLLAESRAQIEAAQRFYEYALKHSMSSSQEAQIGLFMKRGQLLYGESNELLEGELRDKYLASEGTKVGYGYARQYAVILSKLGKPSEAQQLLQSQLQFITPEEGAEKDQINLLIALIAGEDTGIGKAAFKQILKNRGSAKIARIALYTLADVSIEAEGVAEFHAFIDELIGQSAGEEPHPLFDELLYVRAGLLLGKGERVKADADVSRLLEAFPGSAFRQDAIWMRAYIAWSDEPPRYRTAADFLNQLKSDVNTDSELHFLSVLVGDCYYLNKDYETAADLYLATINEDPERSADSSLLLKLAICEIELKEFGRVEQHLDNLELNTVDIQEQRWQAEWNLMQALKSAESFERVFERLKKILELAEQGALPDTLRVRFMWLQAQMSFQYGTEGQIALIPDIAEEIISIVEGLGRTDLEVDYASAEVISSALFLRGQALLKLGNSEQGLAALKELRERYPQSDSAILSYLEEAHFFAKEDKTAQAQSQAVTLAYTFPESSYAPLALYEAAVYAQKQTLERNKEEAIEILEKLCTTYPEHSLAFYARLMQGDILRSLNRFGVALNVYDHLLNDYSAHPELYLAELARARCLMAQSRLDSTLLSEAAAGLDRLFDHPDAPVDLRVEAGYTLGLILVKEGKVTRAQEILWRIINQYLQQPEVAAMLGVKGRYWMAKTVFELGDSLVSEGAPQDARKVFGLIATHGLPGKSLAQRKMELRN